MKLSKVQADELAHVFREEPSSIHEHDREPYRYVRFVSRRSTVEALVRLGLCEPPIMHDYPVGGYRARLTKAGVEERARVRAERAATWDAVRRIARAK